MVLQGEEICRTCQIVGFTCEALNCANFARCYYWLAHLNCTDTCVLQGSSLLCSNFAHYIYDFHTHYAQQYSHTYMQGNLLNFNGLTALLEFIHFWSITLGDCFIRVFQTFQVYSAGTHKPPRLSLNFAD